MKKLSIISSIFFLAHAVITGIPKDFYLAEIDNQSDTIFYLAGSTKWITDINNSVTAKPGGVTAIVNDPSTKSFKEFVGWDTYMNEPTLRYVPRNKDSHMDPNWTEYYFRHNGITMNNTIILIPEPDPTKGETDTCMPTIFVGVQPTLLGSEARNYISAKQITTTAGTQQCCVDSSTNTPCKTDALYQFTAVENFPQPDWYSPGIPAAKLKLTIDKQYKLTLTNI